MKRPITVHTQHLNLFMEAQRELKRRVERTRFKGNNKRMHGCRYIARDAMGRHVGTFFHYVRSPQYSGGSYINAETD
jgi:hypothetical protein